MTHDLLLPSPTGELNDCRGADVWWADDGRERITYLRRSAEETA